MRFEYFEFRLSHTLKSFLARFSVRVLLCGGLCCNIGFATDPGSETAGLDYTTVSENGDDCRQY